MLNTLAVRTGSVVPGRTRKRRSQTHKHIISWACIWLRPACDQMMNVFCSFAEPLNRNKSPVSRKEQVLVIHF
ncbi:unnamed protein product [Pleuronectes platessa]|uniref:Uncharacterized protein n=1 Tax=Pleuronectes platessa TaxID=8262 RepID=A0A9N7UJ88_PLEPL|nr:unnamed protein product [Pleuronectes platessa]